MNIILAILFLFLALTLLVIRKTYYSLPPKELKRKAAKGDPFASAVYHAVAYGNSLRSFLGLVIGLLSAASIILLARALPVWASLLIVGPLLWIAFSWIPTSRVSRPGV